MINQLRRKSRSLLSKMKLIKAIEELEKAENQLLKVILLNIMNMN